MRARSAVLVVAALVVASCGTPSPSTSPRAPTASPTVTSPTASPSPAASPSLPVIGYWEQADTMAVGRGAPHAVTLGDGSVLVVGNDDFHGSLGRGWNSQECVRDNSVITELWDPSPATWRATAGLNNPRADFVAVRLGDRALVTGGVSPGQSGEWDHQSYSSTYIYDPNSGEGWTKAALLGTARADPIAAVLADGRVLVAGGYYLSGQTGHVDPGPASTLADSRLAPMTGPPEVVLADAVEMPRVAALANSELLSSPDRWTPTGPMRYARYGAAAVTLSDGRVLVVGSSLPSWAAYWNDVRVTVDERVYDTAEIYDPTSGRFELTGEIAPIDWSALAELGLSLTLEELVGNGTLVALADGGALLVGRTTRWFADPGSNEGYLVRTLRLDAATGRWAEIDRSLYAWGPGATQVDEIVPGHVSHNAVAAALADGRILVAGGEQATCGTDGSCRHTYVAVESASLYDPATDTWLPLPAMPEPRAGGTPVVLTDGSVLIVGGHTEETPGTGLCGWDATGLASTVRFVPLPTPATHVP